MANLSNQAQDFNQLKIGGYRAEIKNISGTTYSTLATDTGKILRCTNISGCTITLHSGCKVGWSVSVLQGGAGQVTIDTTGISLVSRLGHVHTAGQYALIGLLCTTNSGTAEIVLTGDSAP